MTYKQLFESNSEMNLITVLEKIMSGELPPQEIKNHIDDIEYDEKFTDYINTYDDDEFDDNFLEIELEKFDLAYFESLMDLDKGILKWMDSVGTYNYDYNVDDSEIEYIDNNLNDAITKKMKKFAKELNFDYDESDENICYKFINEYKLSYIKDVYLTELSLIHKNAIEKKKKKEIDDVTPIFFNHENFTINYEEAVKFLKTNKFTDVNTIFELFDKIGETLPYSYEIEYEVYEYENYDDLGKDIENSINMYWDDKYELVEERYWRDLVSDRETEKEFIIKLFDKIDWFEQFSHYQERKYYIEIVSDKLKPWILSNDFMTRLKKYASDYDIKIEDEKMYKLLTTMKRETATRDFNL